MERKVKACTFCGKQFEDKTRNYNQLHCSPKCNRLHKQERSYIQKHKELAFKDNEYIKNKHIYSDKLIDYSASPTGKAYIGFVKKPLMPVKEGYGYLGVKMQTDNRELVQCHECGKWYKFINECHTLTHELPLSDYKEKYGFNKGGGICSDIESNNRSDVMREIMKEYYAESIIRRRAIRKAVDISVKARKVASDANGGHLPGRITFESMNGKGTCPAQLKLQTINFVLRTRRLPSAKSGRLDWSNSVTLQRRFGSMNAAFQLFGLPIKRRISKCVFEYIFPDSSRCVANSKKPHELDKIFSLMLDKCHSLKLNELTA